MCYFCPSASRDDFRVGLETVIHSSNDWLLDGGILQDSMRKEGIGRGERVPILVVLLFDCVGDLFSVGADARVDDSEIKQSRLSCVGGHWQRAPRPP